jgi:hypothetical protein
MNKITLFFEEKKKYIYIYIYIYILHFEENNFLHTKSIINISIYFDGKKNQDVFEKKNNSKIKTLLTLK